MVSRAYNSTHSDQAKRTALLNANVANWLEGGIQIKPEPNVKTPKDLSSVAERYKLCLDAPNYTVFSNVESQNAWISDPEHVDQCNKAPSELGEKPSHYVVSLESPHNAIHLAVGGFYQAPYKDETTGKPQDGYKASDFVDANGEMGCNEMAAFDPIFFLHHCFIDYVFWVWQKRHGRTRAGSLEVIAGYPGSTNGLGLPNIDPGTPLDMQTPLYPFRKQSPAEQQEYYVSDDVVDIEKQLGYSYGTASLDAYMPKPRSAFASVPPPPEHNTALPIIKRYKQLRDIDRAEYSGSFVLRVFATVGDAGEKVEIGREAVLSRWSVAGCANCQAHLQTRLLVPISEPLESALRQKNGGAEVMYDFEIQTALDGTLGSVVEANMPAFHGPPSGPPRSRGTLEDLVPGN